MSDEYLEGLTFSEYITLKGVNASSLKNLAFGSPAKYKWCLEHPQEDKPHFPIGRAVHTLLFEPDLFETEFVVWDGARRSGAKWQEFAEQHASRSILTPADLEQVQAMVASAHRNSTVTQLLSEGQPEITLRWTDAETGIVCKGRVDWLRTDMVVDGKTSRNDEERWWRKDLGQGERGAWATPYNMQFAFYADGVRAVTGNELPFYVLWLSKTPPYETCVMRVPEDCLAAGRKAYKDALKELAWCLETDTWPGRYDGKIL